MKDKFGRSSNSNMLLMAYDSAATMDTIYRPAFNRCIRSSKNIHKLKDPEIKICALPCCWLEATPGKDYCCGEHCKLDRAKKKEIKLNNK
jgi:hypothetical protein